MASAISFDSLGEGQQPGPGQLVELANVALVGQRRDRDIRDVVRVDERLGCLTRRQGHLAAHHGLAPVVLAEVLREPGRAHDRQLGARVGDRLLGALGLLLAAPGQQHQSANPAVHGQLGERADRLDRTRDCDVGVVGDIRGPHALEHRRPARAVLPIERRRARARAHPHSHTARPQPLHHPAAGLTRAPQHQRS